MVSGPVDPVFIRRVAQREDFDQDAFEKAYRLARLLQDIGDHPWLAPRVALKGGTCINLFHGALPRLSVDMDLNYIGAIEKDRMQAEKPEVMAALRDVAKAQGYTPDDVRFAYAGWTVRFVYESVRGQRASVKADVNFLMRVPLYGIEQRKLPAIFALPRAEVPCLTLEEVYGGKFAALAVRGEPRDVFDAAHFIENGSPGDPERLRKAFLFHASMSDATLRTVDLETIQRLTADAYRQRLYPLLRRADKPDTAQLQALVLPRLSEMLTLTSDEKEFGRRLEEHEYDPSLLFGDVSVGPDVASHPAAEWRRLKPHGKLPGIEGEPA